MLRIQLLGPVAAVLDGDQLSLGGPKQRTVLAVLAHDPGKTMSVDRLIEAVWGDDVPSRASRSVSTYVSNLRGVLGDVIRRDGSGYVLALDRSRVDATAFADQVRAAQHRMSAEPSEAAAAIREALSLWTGEPFQGVDGHHVLEPEISRLTELKLEGLEAAIAAEIEAGSGDLVELDRLVAEYPHRERIRGLKMRALYAAGRQADALASYKAFRDQLASDLGIDPSPELQELELRILQQDPTLVRSEAIRAASAPGSLPVRYSSFVGRAEEIAEVAARIGDDRLVTVVGPGGIGKSSLVVEAARRGDVHTGDEVVRVAVDTLGHAELIDALIAALGLDPAPGVDPIDVITGFLAAHRHLLILDGCEVHLDTAARIADRLLSSSPETRILATSREPLGLAGEAIVRVGGLSTVAAAELFASRAKLRALDDETSGRVEELCTALDGMPLAVELAAARARSVPLDRLVQRINDLIPLLRKSRTSGERHDSIAEAMGWSYDLLEDTEQQALRWLSVFPNGFDRQDAEAMLDDPYAEDVLARLVDVSLVQPIEDSGRHRMLEPVRQYAAHLLDETGESDTAHLQHALWIADESKRVGRDLWSPRFREARTWLLERSYDAGRAMEWAVTHDHPDIAVEILCGSGQRLASYGDRLGFVDRALAVISHPEVRQDGRLALAMVETATMAAIEHRYDEALALFDRAEVAAKAAKDSEATGAAMAGRAILMNTAFASQPQHLDEMIEAMRLLEDAGSILAKVHLLYRAIILSRLGRLDEGVADMVRYEAWATSVRGRPEWNTIGWRGRMARLSGDRRAASGFDRDLTDVAHANLDFWLEQSMWESIAVDAAVLEDEPLMAKAIDRIRGLEERTGAPLGAFVETRVASAQGRHEDVLSAARRWFEQLMERIQNSESARPFVIGYAVAGDATREPDFFEILLPVAVALEATGRTDSALRIAREAPALMAQSNFGHWDELGETKRWADLLDRLGGGEPEGLTLEEGFDMVHDILAADD